MSKKELIEQHNRFVEEQLNKARNGESINLTDLFISKQKLEEKLSEIKSDDLPYQILYKQLKQLRPHGQFFSILQGLGASDFVHDGDNKLIFRAKTGNKRFIVRIDLQANDLYHVVIENWRGMNCKTIYDQKDIYVDHLADLLWDKIVEGK